MKHCLSAPPDYVLGGFHLSRRTITESDATLNAIAAFLMERDALYYSGHCTGAYPFQWLKQRMGNRIKPLFTGLEISI